MPATGRRPATGDAGPTCREVCLLRRSRSTPPTSAAPPKNPAWFDEDRAYELTDPDKYPVHVVAKYPDSGEQLRSGWLIGGEYLNGAVNALSWRVGNGYLVTFGSGVAFRTWNRGEEKMIFNAMYHGPAQQLTPEQFARLGR